VTFGHIMSVGRLDYNSEGLLLMTNDNALKGILESPETRLPRLYRVKVHGRITSEKLKKMQSPIVIQSVTYGPLKVGISRELQTNSWLDVTL
jgi:23S rRNA pseudouridine2605 synthase